MIYRTRVEVGSTGTVSYYGTSAQLALDATRVWKPWRGERVVCEVQVRDGWVTVITIEGGRPQVCPRCDGDVACWKCHGRGYV